MKKLLFTGVLFLSAATCVHAQGTGQDEQQIAAMIEKINYSWTTIDGANTMSAVLSDSNFFTIMHNAKDESKSVLLDRTAFLKAFANLLKNNMPKKHVHKIKAITIYGPIAYEIGTLEDTAKDGTESAVDTFNVFIKTANGWRLQMSIPLAEMQTAIDKAR